MNSLKQNIGNVLGPIRDAAANCFAEVGNRCHKVLGFAAAHFTGRGAEANKAAMDGFKEDVANLFEKGGKLINEMQDTHRRDEMDRLMEKQIKAVQSIIGEIDNPNLANKGSKITDKMKDALIKAYEDASQKAESENEGIFTKEIRDELKANIRKIAKDAKSEAWGLRGTEIMRDRAETLLEKVEQSKLSDENKEIAKKAIQTNFDRYTTDQESASELNRSELRIANRTAKVMEKEVDRLMKVLDRIEKIEGAAAEIQDEGIKDLVKDLRTSLAKKNEDSYFSPSEYQDMQKDLDNARNRIMGHQVRGKLAEGLDGMAKAIEVKEDELMAGIGRKRELREEPSEESNEI